MKIGPFQIHRIKKGTCFQPEYKQKTEHAFTIQGTEFYWFKDLLDMPVKRYQRVSQFITETDLRLSRKDIEDYVEVITKQLNDGNITRAAMMLGELKYQNEMFIETDTFYRLFSCVFFTADEDLTDYDFGIGDEKIALFKKENIGSFFLTTPCKRFLPQVDISAEDLETFSKVQQTRKQYRDIIKDGTLKDESVTN
jgi:hypothetical protein